MTLACPLLNNLRLFCNSEKLQDLSFAKLMTALELCRPTLHQRISYKYQLKYSNKRKYMCKRWHKIRLNMSRKGCKVCGKILQSALVASTAHAKLNDGSSPFVCITCVSDSIQVRKKESTDDLLQRGRVSEMALHPKLNKNAQVDVDVMSILAKKQIFLQGIALPQELAVICGPMPLQPYTIEVLHRSKTPLGTHSRCWRSC